MNLRTQVIGVSRTTDPLKSRAFIEMPRTLVVAICAGGMLAAAAAARADSPLVANALINLLDYIAVEYAEFVEHGEVLDEHEYEEQVEFSRQVAAGIAALPNNPLQEQIDAEAHELARLIESKADGERVAGLARKLQRDLVSAYGIPVAPPAAPDLSTAPALYQTACAGCHGTLGDGDGPQAAGVEPKPTDFRDPARQAQRTVFGYYNTITLGVEGTAMAGYAQLPSEERWALAFHLTGFASDSTLVARGRELWQSPGQPARFQSLADITTTTPAEAAAAGPETAAVLAYLRAEPAALAATQPGEAPRPAASDFPREILVILLVGAAVLVVVYRRALSRRRAHSRSQHQ
jgi:high-affinity iron transporter